MSRKLPAPRDEDEVAGAAYAPRLKFWLKPPGAVPLPKFTAPPAAPAGVFVGSAPAPKLMFFKAARGQGCVYVDARHAQYNTCAVRSVVTHSVRFRG